ncbi:MAG TPA: DUF2169 domain-containing protein, partial [Planctomycetota bacterium]|nr:DUF2169 domain-containing protein [Planctomycetota bacterium]
MRVVAEQGLAVAWLATSLVRPERHGVFVCKATFALDGQELRLQPEGMGPMGDVDGGLEYPSDFVPFKPRADVVVRAVARPQGGQPAKYVAVSMQVGALSKQLVVAGDRRWQRGLLGRSPGEPVPFTEMPITWSRALGGPGDAANTVGVGRDGDVLPNIELRGKLLQSPADRLPPAGFGPIRADWEPRRSQTGTYRGDYVQKHWPWFPPDFDYSYFNAAPRDQQVEGFLRGDEAMQFENL